MHYIWGTGTLYLDWRDAGLGRATATLWFCVLYMPVVPIRKSVIQFGPRAGRGWLVPLTLIYEFSTIERLPLRFIECLKTLFVSWIVRPIIAFGPWVIGGLINAGVHKITPERLHSEEWFRVVSQTAFGCGAVWLLVYPAILLVRHMPSHLHKKFYRGD
jgi:hypothetical protein